MIIILSYTERRHLIIAPENNVIIETINTTSMAQLRENKPMTKETEFFCNDAEYQKFLFILAQMSHRNCNGIPFHSALTFFSFLSKTEPKFFVIWQSTIATMLIIRGQFTEISSFFLFFGVVFCSSLCHHKCEWLIRYLHHGS